MEIIKKLLLERKMFAYKRQFLKLSNGMISNCKNCSVKAEKRGRHEKLPMSSMSSSQKALKCARL